MKDHRGEEMTIAGQAADVYVEVALERKAQDAKWGPQNHPMVSGAAGWQRSVHMSKADDWKNRNDQRVKERRISWDGILLEEVHESFAEADPAKVRAELVQVAAVAIAAIESIDRNELA